MKVVFFDCETSGLLVPQALPIEKQPQIIELFALAMEQEGEGETATFSELGSQLWLVNPGKPLQAVITKITGIKDADLKDKPTFAAVADEIIAFFAGSDRMVAHNLSFDAAMLRIELTRAEKDMKWPEPFCTVEQSIGIKGYRLKLIDLYEHLFGERFESAHRAENDVRAMARCYCEMVKRDLI